MEEVAELSLNSVVGLSTPKTMKVKEKIGHQEVIALIDCGATHNFISNRVVQLLRLPLEATTILVFCWERAEQSKEQECARGLLSLSRISKLSMIFYL